MPGLAVRQRYLLFAVLAAAALLRLPNLAGPDMVGDPTAYSFRAIGYFDWIGSLDTQTTPVVWFDEAQWWQGLSFHDAPPLVFAAQRLAFLVFGQTIWAARIPFVLAGLLAVFGIYLLGRELGGRGAGLAAAGTLALMGYHVWISRTGFLDGFVVLWIIYSLYFFLRAARDPRWYLAWGAAAGLGLISKYTFLFMGLAFLGLLLTSHRRAWRTRQFYAGIVILLAIIAPVVTYNVMVWQTRGHLDAALSTLVGQSPEDYRILVREVRTSPGGILAAFREVRSQMSVGLQLAALAALAGAAYAAARRESGAPLRALWLALGSAALMFAAVGGDARFAVVLAPLLALTVGWGIAWLWERMWGQSRTTLIAALAAMAAWETAFALQSHVISEPLLAHPLLQARRPVTFWHGYNELDAFLDRFYRAHPNPNYYVFAQEPQIAAYKERVIRELAARSGNAPQTTHALVYDDRIDWFASLWLVERRRLYQGAFIPSLTNFIQAIEEGYLGKFREFGFTDVTFVISTDRVTRETVGNAERLERFSQALAAAHEPRSVIRNYRGEAIFNVYELPLDVAYFSEFR